MGADLSFRELGFGQTRFKAKLAIRGSSAQPQIGLFKEGTHEVLSIPECMVHRPEINEAVAILKQSIGKRKIAPYSETTHEGQLRYAQFFVERKTGRVQLALVVNSVEIDPELELFLKDLAQYSLWHSIWINCNPSIGNRIFSDQWIHWSGEEWLTQTLRGVDVAFHPGAFSQVHLPLFEQMLRTVAEWIPQNSHCLELFAGTGAIALSLGSKCRWVELVENNPFGALSFQESLKKVENRYDYRLGNAVGPLKTYDAIIVDPPRKGLGKELLHALKDNTSRQLIYISCSFESFIKDAEELCKSGWKLETGVGFFLFPGTNEIEIAARFISTRV